MPTDHTELVKRLKEDALSVERIGLVVAPRLNPFDTAEERLVVDSHAVAVTLREAAAAIERLTVQQAFDEATQEFVADMVADAINADTPEEEAIAIDAVVNRIRHREAELATKDEIINQGIAGLQEMQEVLIECRKFLAWCVDGGPEPLMLCDPLVSVIDALLVRQEVSDDGQTKGY